MTAPNWARVAELIELYAVTHPREAAAERKRWAVEAATYEAEEREAIQNEK